MYLWICIAAFAQLLTAGAVFIDKYVLVHKEHVGKPVVYAFYVSMLSGVVIILLPFGIVSIPPVWILLLAIVNSIVFITGLIALYTALKEGHASDVIPIVSAVSALTTAFLAHTWLNEDLPASFFPAFALMVLGTLLISHFRLTNRQRIAVILAGSFLGAVAFTSKIILLNVDFIDGFFWTRMTNVVGALFLLTIPAYRTLIFKGFHHSSSGTKWLVVSNKALNGFATVLTLLAISLGSVSLVQALSGLQFVFLLVFAYMFSGMFPRVLRGEIEKKGRVHKLFGVGLIVLGLGCLFVV